jgi:predicted transcriptional regulator of viral defense system
VLGVTTTTGGRPVDFFARHPVFTYDEFAAAHQSSARKPSPRTTMSLLRLHVAAGRLVRVRRGLYASVSPGAGAGGFEVDPYLVASRLAPDAVVAYHAALQFRGKSYSVWHRVTFLTATKAKPVAFRGTDFQPVQVPQALRSLPDAGGGVVEERHAGGTVRVTTFERTLVDVLDDPRLGGGWEEIWRSLEMVEFFDLDAVVKHALTRPALTVARVGFFLEQHRGALMVEERHLAPLRERVPRQARYLGTERESGHVVKPWNLVVPPLVLERSWGAVP